MVGDRNKHLWTAFFFRTGRTQTSKITQWNVFGLDNLFYKHDVSSTRDRKSISFILGGSALGTLRNKRVLLKRAYTLSTKAGWIIHPPAAEHGRYLYNISNTENWLLRKGNVLNYAEILPWNINRLRMRPETPFMLRARCHDTNWIHCIMVYLSGAPLPKSPKSSERICLLSAQGVRVRGWGKIRTIWLKENQMLFFCFCNLSFLSFFCCLLAGRIRAYQTDSGSMGCRL